MNTQPQINRTDLTEITELMRLFPNVALITDTIGRVEFRGVMPIELPYIGKCEISYLPRENDFAVYAVGNGRRDEIISGLKMTVTPNTTVEYLETVVAEAVIEEITDAFKALPLQSLQTDQGSDYMLQTDYNTGTDLGLESIDFSVDADNDETHVFVVPADRVEEFKSKGFNVYIGKAS